LKLWLWESNNQKELPLCPHPKHNKSFSSAISVQLTFSRW